MDNNLEKVDMHFTYWECHKNTHRAQETYAFRYPSNYYFNTITEIILITINKIGNQVFYKLD
jgi:hypothetical protein